MTAMTIESSPIEREILAVEQALERFRQRAVAELWRLKDRMPQSPSLACEAADHGSAITTDSWQHARRRHYLACRGLIPWRADLIPSARSVAILRSAHQRQVADDRSAKPRAA